MQQGFTALCERLLQQPDPALRGLPQRCLQQLLAFARRPGQGRSDIVRRSAGLPYGVVAIFYSEPVGSQKALLQRGMRELLAAAGDEGSESWPRVHALNCMRAAFQDANLSVDTSAYLAAGMQATILGMAAPQWEVRNAASLAYTALLVRVLGFRNHAGKGTVAAKRAPTAADFFVRYPQLHPFLLQQLAAAADSLEASAGGGSNNGSRNGELHPSMFPVLVLLSRLRPSRQNKLSGGSGSSGLAEQQLSPAPFAALAQRCAAASAAAVRQLAANALPPLLPPEQQPAAAAALAVAVRDTVQATAMHALLSAAADSEHAPPHRPSFNALHGKLLQLRALLEAAGGEGADPSAAAALLASVAAPLAACAGSACCLDASGGCLPAAVCLEYIRTAAAAAALLPDVQQLQSAAAQETAAQTTSWLGAVQQQCWAALERSAHAEPPRDYGSPMLSCAYKHATQLCFQLLVDAHQRQPHEPEQQQSGLQGAAAAAGSTLLQQLEAALNSSIYEVRCAALKVLLRHTQQQRRHQVEQPGPAAGLQHSDGQLRGLLLRKLAGEAHHKARRRMLHLLALLPTTADAAAGTAGGATRAGATPATAAAAAAQREFGSMLGHATTAVDSRIKQHAVACLGPLLQRQRIQGSAHLASPAHAAAEQLLEVARECSHPTQLPELRLAAALALADSGLLLLLGPGRGLPEAAGAAGNAAVGAWEVLLLLLEDEEDEVREVASAAAAAALEASPPSGSNSSKSSGGHGGNISGGSGNGIAAAGAASGAGAEPACPSEEHMLRRLFPALAHRFGPHPALLALFCRLCCPEAAAASAAVAAAGGSGTAAPAGAAGAAAPAAAIVVDSKIFDREPDNTHEEPLLLAQLAGSALAQLLPCTAGDSAVVAAVQSWAGAALRLLQQRAAQLAEAGTPGSAAAATAVASAQAEVTPLHQQHFAELHCAWLALWAAAHLPAASWGEQHGAMSSAVAALGAGAAGAAAAASSAPQLEAVSRAAVDAWTACEPGQVAASTLFFLL